MADDKQTIPVLWSTFGWQMMAMLMDNFEGTLANLLTCLAETSSMMRAKYAQDNCPDFESTAQSIRRKFGRAYSADDARQLFFEVSALSQQIQQFLDERLEKFDQNIEAYGEGPAVESLVNGRQRLLCVGKALGELAEAIEHQINAVVALKEANLLAVDGRYL